MGLPLHTSPFYQNVRRRIQCTLCPHRCIIQEGKFGLCGVRRNIGGKMRTRNYGIISGLALDPIEKKPLCHFFPGSKILSLGSWGCNLKCNFCQNWQISQTCNEDELDGEAKSLQQILDIAQSTPNNIGIAYTYNEPTVWFEFMFDLAQMVHNAGLKNIVVSNGYINREPLLQLIPFIDAFNIDLKGFTSSFYSEMAKGQLNFVLDSIKTIKSEGKHLELTNLIIPGKNDNEHSFNEMIDWICNELGNDTVLHLSRYFPRFKQNLPATPVETLFRLAEMARTKLKFVYVGNVQDSNSTKCPSCGADLIERNGYDVKLSDHYDKGRCKNCNLEFIIDKDKK